MAEDSDSSSAGPLRADPAATAIAFGSGAALDPRAREFLEEQTRLTRLQIEELKREDKLRHWSLVVHHVNDVMKLTFQFAGVFIVLAIAMFIGTAVWNAANDSSLVIDAFSVPPDMAARGLTGQAVAAQLQDKLAAMQDATDSARPANSYANNWGNDIKVQIPDTGVSIGEFYLILTMWLGHQTHITGEIYHTAKGITIAARAGGDSGETVSGVETDLDKLLQQSAEAIYAHTQPYRYAVYLPPGDPRAWAIFQKLAVSGPLLDRIWAHVGMGSLYDYSDPLRAPAEQRKSVALAPDFALPYENLTGDESNLGHDEASLAAGQKAIALLQQGNGGMSERAAAISLASIPANVAFTLDDFATSLREYQEVVQLPDYAGIVEFAREQIVANLALLHEISAAHQARRDLPSTPNPVFRTFREGVALTTAYWNDEWSSVLARRAGVEKAVKDMAATPGYTEAYVNATLPRQVWPYAATAMAMTADFKGADALIAQTPLDCYPCVRARANIAAAEKNWSAASRWFARAVAQAPSIPMAYFEWGKMLIAKDDLDGAIAKFSIANQKGPHFADPLDIWGEALMQKNRSDLALAKFEEAAKCAPNWGRLHLKWGEALYYAGQRDEAKKQFAIAAHLDLTPVEISELAKMNPHG